MKHWRCPYVEMCRTPFLDVPIRILGIINSHEMTMRRNVIVMLILFFTLKGWCITSTHSKAKTLQYYLGVICHFCDTVIQMIGPVGNKNLVASTWQYTHPLFTSDSDIPGQPQHSSGSSGFPLSRLDSWWLLMFAQAVNAADRDSIWVMR